LKVAWFAPVKDGAVADYSRGVLAAMVRLCEPHLFCDGRPEHVPPGVAVEDLAARPQALADLSSYEAVFYNLADDFGQCGWIFDVARLNRGIVVLHAVTLHSFFVEYYLDLRRPDLYITRMAERFGIAGLTTAHRVLGPCFDPDRPRLDFDELLRYTFAEEAVRSASGAVVHSKWHGEILRQLWTGPVCETWLPAHGAGASSVSGDGGAGNHGARPITLMTIGPLEPTSRVADVVEILAEDRELAERTRYVIVGAYDRDDSYVREVKEAIAQGRLGGTVQMLGQLSPGELDRRASAADVFVNLRHPDGEGCSMCLMYLLPFGKPVITYDRGSFAEVPNQAVAKVAMGDKAGLHRTLRELVDSAARREAIGAAGKCFADRHTYRDYARELLRFARQDVSTYVAESLAQDESRALAEGIAGHVGEALASLGVEPASPAVEAVIHEAANLLWPAPGGNRSRDATAVFQHL
jgi:glycosyltransferase involved in cell wall biosynthesis